jgi:parallel beta-helix repeat protein
MLSLLVISTLALAFEIQIVKADFGTIYINADGSISPSTAPIYTADNITYTLTGNVSYPAYNGIVVERNNTVMDGNGYTVIGNNSGKILDSSVGIGLTDRSNVTIKNASVKGFCFGIALDSSSYNNVSLNRAAANCYGIYINALDSSYNTICGNTATGNSYDGIVVFGSYNVISGNNATANSFDGIALEQSSYDTVIGNKATENYWGISLFGSYNVISGNNVTANSGNGMVFDLSQNNNVTGNSVMANSQVGIWLEHQSNNNTIVGNNVTTNGDGIYLLGSSNEIVIENNVTANRVGINLWNSITNTIYHNNFIGNVVQILTHPPSFGNVWDNGYPSGGNYWSDYNGMDSYSGPYQNLTGSDGIGDTPYVIDSNNTDNYPLMSPWIHIVGDVNFDGRVGLDDLVLLVNAYNSKVGDPNWNPLADMAAPYGIVGLTDLVTMAMHYGQHDP